MPWLVTTGPSALYVTLFLFLFGLVSMALGRRLLILAKANGHTSPLERAALALVLGVGVLQLVCFLLGVAGFFTISGLRAACGVVLVASAFDAWAVLRRAWAELPSLLPAAPWLRLWLLALLPGIGLALLLAIAPTVDPDGLGYHLTVPKRWLSLGSLEYLPTYPYSNTPMGVEMLFALGMSLAGDAAAKSIHFLLGITAAVALFHAGRRLSGDTLGALAVTVLFFGPFGIASLMGWAYVEAAAAAALLTSTLAWLIWFRERQTGLLTIAGLLAGIGVSFKLTAALFPVVLGALTVVLLWHEGQAKGESLLTSVMPVVKLIPVLALPVLPWLLRSALVTGNPFFPMFAQQIQSRDFTGPQSAAFDSYNRYLVWGVGAGAEWGLGMRKAILAGVALAIAAVGLFVQRRLTSFTARTTARFVLGAIILQLAAAGLYKRYWIPLLAVVELPLLLLLGDFLRRAWLRPALVAGTALLSLLAGLKALDGVQRDIAGLAKTALGLEPQTEFLRRQLPLYPLYEKANRELAPNAGVMLAMYCGGFHLDRSTYCVDIVQSSLRVSSWPEFVEDLRRLGVTHTLAPREWEAPFEATAAGSRIEVGNTSFLVRPQEHEMVGRLLREHGRLLSAAADQGLYAIELPR